VRHINLAHESKKQNLIFVIVILGYIFDSSFNNFPQICSLASNAVSQSGKDYAPRTRLELSDKSAARIDEVSGDIWGA